MTQTNPVIRCKNCGTTFEPNVKTKGTWNCPSCQARNPNLKRHYISVADLCILGLIFTVIMTGLDVKNNGLQPRVLLSIAHALLLLVTIVFVYKSKTPWSDRTAKTLIWVVFILALVFNVVAPFLFTGRLNIPGIILYAVIFPYLFWLSIQAGICTATEPPTLPETMESQ